MSVPTPPPAPRPSGRRLPIGMLGMLALVAAIELGIEARKLDFTSVWADDWRLTARAATRKAPGRDLLCFGDSLIKFGVLPHVIKARTGMQAYNLALNAGTVPSSYFLLQRALGAGARPKAIIVDFFALMQPDLPRNSIRLYPDLATTGECLELARVAGDAEFFNTTMMGKILPSYKCRFEIRDSVKAALDGRRASPWPAMAWVWENWKAQDGAQPMPPPGTVPPASPCLVHDISPPVGWMCDAINATFVEKFLALAKEHQIPVFWAICPIGPEVQARRDHNRTDEAYDRFARATLQRHPEVVVIDGRHSRYDASAFFDPMHLNGHGADIFTCELAAKVLDRMEGRDMASNWVTLPAYDDRTQGLAHVGAIDTQRR